MATVSPHDIDPLETQEWLEALESVIEVDGFERAQYILSQVIDRAQQNGCSISSTATTSYINTITATDQPAMPGDRTLEDRIRAIIRWNAMALVLRGSKKDLDLGGHIASFASSETLYDVCFNHFFKAPNEKDGGDLVYYQGHIAPGIYARSFLENRLTTSQLDNFRQEVDGQGLSSYPHPKLMPTYWQFPTVSMGLGPMQAIYQARFLRYLTSRGLKDCSEQMVYCFMGDGECDEPESLGAITLAARENLDNLVFIINCNLQRLDGPVRGNSKIIQELEGLFKGAGWDVIKVIWGSEWDGLLAKDTSGKLLQLMQETIDGEYQDYASKDGAYMRQHFFGKYPETAALVANMSDDEIFALKRGGHDPVKVYAAFAEAQNKNGKPTLILPKTIKGYGMGAAAEARNIAHQVKKLDEDSVRHYRDRFNLPIDDNQLADIPYYHPGQDSPEIQYMLKQRQALKGMTPQRLERFTQALTIPKLSAFDAVLKGTDNREVSTTMSFVRIMATLLKDKNIGKRIVPIIPDEARTFGMEGLFRQIGIYSSLGQNYTPQDKDQMAYYKEDQKGQVLQEGINELGAMCSWVNAATSYSTNDCPMIPFYIYYSMFGFQRIGDMAWAAGDMRARGFLLGATAGRTTLNGEGLQHQDGHSHIQAGVIPNCLSYDPTYAYEVAVIVQDGLKRMYGDEQEDIFYYITLMNENYAHPAIPDGCEKGILKGIYQLEQVSTSKQTKLKAQLLGCGTILEQVRVAAKILANEFEISSDIYSVTSFNELGRDGQDCERHNMLNHKDQRVPFVTQVLKDDCAVIAATDYMKSYAEQIRAYVPTTYKVLGTDGFGRSDSRENLRDHFEVSAKYIVIATLKTLAERKEISADVVTNAIKKYDINPKKINPLFA
jgi:pyruvate dehydrogenase E1 component